MFAWMRGGGGDTASESDLAELRHDLVALSARYVSSVERTDERLAAIEARLALPVEDAAVRAALEAAVEDLHVLRDSVRYELSAVDDELGRLADQIEDVAGSSEGLDPTAPLHDAEEPRHVVLSADPDPGVRFSALVRLGRRRTDRSLQASIARLEDPSERVVWAALRNLGAFREPSTAPDVAALLAHERAVVRTAAFDALRTMGAPRDIGYDPVLPAEEREPAEAQLRAWAAEFAGQ